jgi:hypothetical protein
MSQDQDASTYQAHLQAGNALVQQAQRLPRRTSSRHAFWQAAGKEFYLAHKADMSEPEAAFRLAQAWMAEAHAKRKRTATRWSCGPTPLRNASWPSTWSRERPHRHDCRQLPSFANQTDAAKAWQLIGKQLLPPEPSAPDA